jgi:hypothetical protein
MHWWLLMAAAIVIAGWAIIATFRMWPEEDRAHWKRPVEGFWQGFVFDPVVLYFAFALAGFFMIGKAGSAENYLLEPLAALAIFLGCGMGRLGEAAVRKSAGMILPLTFLVAATACLAVHTHIIATPAAQQLRFSQYDRLNMLDLRAAEEVRRAVRASQTPTFTEYAIFNLQSGRDPVLQPFIMSELARQGKWDQTPFLKMLQDQKLKLVVTNSNVLSLEATDVYTKEMLDHFKRYYKLEKTVPTGSKRFFYLLRPKTDEDHASEGDSLVMRPNDRKIVLLTER